jgi:hypothetical protein
MSEISRRADRLAQITSQVDYHRRRLVLHQRLHGSHPSARLAELEHAYQAAQDRLSRHAPASEAADGDAGGGRGSG